MQHVGLHFLSFKPWSRHGVILVVAGITYIAIGTVFVFSIPSESQVEALYFAIHLMSLDWWGFGFIITGIVAITSSRWPNLPRSWGYTVLTGWSAAWSAFYFAGAALTDAKVVYFGTAVIWALLAFLWWAVSGLVSPPKEDAT